MKGIYSVGALAVLAFGATAAYADVAIGVAIHGEIVPGVYGRVDLGGRPPPAVVYEKPVIIEQPAPQAYIAEPLYLHVPPEYARDWRVHCHEYGACNRRVYFVKSREYDPAYIRAHHREHEEALLREQRYHQEHVIHEEQRHEEIRHEERHEERHDDHYDHGHDHDHDHDHDDHDHHY
jgi:hypothetical protein